MGREATVQPGIDIRRSSDRFKTRLSWLDSRHSFSFSRHWDPTNTHHGLLLVNNDDIVRPGTGFETHPHQDMEIVTWVLQGSLVHQDSTGHNGVIYPGLAQRMSAGTGILHSEKNDAYRRPEATEQREPVRFIQMWVPPHEQNITPGYEQLEIEDSRLRGSLVTVASGMSRHTGDTAIRIANRYAALHAARLEPGDAIEVPDAPFVHLFIARGSVDVEDAGELEEGDAARLSAAGARRLAASQPSEVLIWEMHTTLDGAA
jgi:hypothetical protein